MKRKRKRNKRSKIAHIFIRFSFISVMIFVFLSSFSFVAQNIQMYLSIWYFYKMRMHKQCLVIASEESSLKILKCHVNNRLMARILFIFVLDLFFSFLLLHLVLDFEKSFCAAQSSFTVFE